MNSLPSQPVLHEWLDYDAATGIFRWAKEPRPARSLLGQVAGTRRGSGHIYIGVRGFPQLAAHRIAWVWMHGSISDEIEIDHEDGNPSNNAISNLRLATSAQQKMNKGVQSNSRSGLKGAYYHACRKGKKWRSQIKVGQRLIFLGYFDTAREAHGAYLRAASQHFGQFACTADRVERLAT
jgi:hypothetical protein